MENRDIVKKNACRDKFGLEIVVRRDAVKTELRCLIDAHTLDLISGVA